MEKVIRFELESNICPEGAEPTEIICGWMTHQLEPDLGMRELSYIYCPRPRSCWFGSDDCDWKCWEAKEMRE
jgi:hypothetical protein